MSKQAKTETRYRANYGDGTHSTSYADRRDALVEKWGRAGIVQYRTSIEASDDGGETWNHARAIPRGIEWADHRGEARIDT